LRLSGMKARSNVQGSPGPRSGPGRSRGRVLMLRLRRGAPRISRKAFAIVVIAMFALLLTGLDAEARSRRARADDDSDSGWREGFASIVVDAKTGKTLQETKADLPPHPA